MFSIMEEKVYIFIVNVRSEDQPTLEVQLAKGDIIPYINENLGKSCYSIGCSELGFYLTSAEMNGAIREDLCEPEDDPNEDDVPEWALEEESENNIDTFFEESEEDEDEENDE